MKVIDKPINEIVPYEKNPRKNDKAVEYVANSIREFGFRVPVVVDKNGVIICGHTRVKAAKELGLDTVPCIAADDLTPEQVKALRLADNKTSEIAEWDLDLLDEELQSILDLDMSIFGFEDGEDDDSVLGENPYTSKVKVPQYEPTGEMPELSDLVDFTKRNALEEEIDESDLPDDEKEFLKIAARRHDVFNYKKIAEYYAHASKEMQELMEKSALVIIDVNDAIANGYVKLTQTLEDLLSEDE